MRSSRTTTRTSSRAADKKTSTPAGLRSTSRALSFLLLLSFVAAALSSEPTAWTDDVHSTVRAEENEMVAPERALRTPEVKSGMEEATPSVEATSPPEDPSTHHDGEEGDDKAGDMSLQDSEQHGQQQHPEETQPPPPDIGGNGVTPEEAAATPPEDPSTHHDGEERDDKAGDVSLQDSEQHGQQQHPEATQPPPPDIGGNGVTPEEAAATPLEDPSTHHDGEERDDKAGDVSLQESEQHGQQQHPEETQPPPPDIGGNGVMPEEAAATPPEDPSTHHDGEEGDDKAGDVSLQDSEQHGQQQHPEATHPHVLHNGQLARDVVGDTMGNLRKRERVEDETDVDFCADRVLFEMIIWMRERGIHIPWGCNADSGFPSDMTTDSLKRTLARSPQCITGLSFAVRQALSAVLEDSKKRDEDYELRLADLDSLKSELKRTRARLDSADQHVSKLLKEAAEAKVFSDALGEQQDVCTSNTAAVQKHAKIESDLRSELEILSNAVDEAEEQRRVLESALDEKTKLLAQTKAIHKQELMGCAGMKRFEKDVMNDSEQGSEFSGEASKRCERGEDNTMYPESSGACSSTREDADADEKLPSFSTLDHANSGDGANEKNTSSASKVLQKMFVFARRCVYKAWSVMYPILQSIVKRAWASRLGSTLEDTILRVVSRVKLFVRRVDGILGTSLEQQHDNITSVVQATMFVSLLFVLYLAHVVWRGTRALIMRFTGSSSSSVGEGSTDGKGRRGSAETSLTSAGGENFRSATEYQGFRLAGDEHQRQQQPAVDGSDAMFKAGGFNTAVPLISPPSVPVMQPRAMQHHADPLLQQQPAVNSWKPPSFVPPATHMDQRQQQQQQQQQQQPPSSMSTVQYGQGPPTTRLYGGHNAPPHMRRPPGAPPPRANNLLPPHVAPGFRAPGPPRGPPPRRLHPPVVPRGGEDQK